MSKNSDSIDRGDHRRRMANLALIWSRLRKDEASDLLVLLSISMIFLSPGLNFPRGCLVNVQKRSSAFFLMNAFNALATVGFAYWLSDRGLVGIGVGWLIGQAVSALVYLVISVAAIFLFVFPIRPQHGLINSICGFGQFRATRERGDGGQCSIVHSLHPVTSLLNGHCETGFRGHRLPWDRRGNRHHREAHIAHPCGV